VRGGGGEKENQRGVEFSGKQESAGLDAVRGYCRGHGADLEAVCMGGTQTRRLHRVGIMGEYATLPVRWDEGDL